MIQSRNSMTISQIIKRSCNSMNKIYAFIIIIPLIALLFLKTMTFYEFDTKQRYIKNTLDGVAHKVMITGVMTVSDKEGLLDKLRKLSNFDDEDVTFKCGNINSDGTLADLYLYVPGNILRRGEIFSIYLESKDESTFSRMEGNSADANNKLFYKAKAICRIEKSQQED